LIRDFTPYDAHEVWYFGRPGGPPPPPPPPSLQGGLGLPSNPAKLGLNWVGDLILQFEVRTETRQGEILVELVKGGRRFLCRLDLAEGTAALALPGIDTYRPTSSAGIRWPGRHSVRFANVDQELLLWIDGQVVPFDHPTDYSFLKIDTRVPNKDDVLPVKLGSHGVSLHVSHLKIFRDIYYIAQESRDKQIYPPVPTDLDPQQPGYPFTTLSTDRLTEFFSDPHRWEVFGHRRHDQFTLGKDQYLMLGDNSAASFDSRLWNDGRFYVNRGLLVGEALIVYWPHSWNRVPGTPIPFPFFPDFARMRLIR
jgi:signal peptidase I